MTTGIQARFRTLRIVKPLHPLAFRKPVPRACSNLAQLPIGFRTIHPPAKGRHSNRCVLVASSPHCPGEGAQTFLEVNHA